MNTAKPETQNSRFVLLLIAAGAVLAYIFWPHPPPPDLSVQLGVLRTHKERSESYAQYLRQDAQGNRISAFDWQKGRDDYTRLAAEFNGCIESLDYALVTGMVAIDLPERFEAALLTSDAFEAWYVGLREPASMPAPPVGGGSPPALDHEYVETFQGVVEWAQQMRQKRRDAEIEPIRAKLRDLRWKSFGEV